MVGNSVICSGLLGKTNATSNQQERKKKFKDKSIYNTNNISNEKLKNASVSEDYNRSKGQMSDQDLLWSDIILT